MLFNNIFIDLDDTLYEYNELNLKVLNLTFDYIHSFNNNLKLENIKKLYEKYRKENHKQLENTAASHNRFIVFKKMLTELNLSLNYLIDIDNYYWKVYFENMKLNDGALDFLKLCKKLNLKLCLITDFLCKKQIEKLKKLNIFHFFDKIITSEEIGCEKPSKEIFYKAISELNADINNSCMIGDNFNKDILGANNLGMYGFWFNSKNENNLIFNSNNCEFSSFNILYTFFKNFYENVNWMSKISRYSGERFDLVQAGGGNISFKQNDLLIIKSSGKKLSDINNYDGYTIIKNENVINGIKNMNINVLKKQRENNAKQIILNNTLIKTKRASIETTLHSILKKYTLHLHPIQVNILAVQKNGNKILSKLFPKSLIIDYFTPGIDLALEIKKKYNNEEIIFLLNHGVIFTTDNKKNLVKIINNTLIKIEKFLNLDFEKYKKVNEISDTYKKIFSLDVLTYLSEDNYLKNNINNICTAKSLYPDFTVYCGYECLSMDKLDKYRLIKTYKKSNIIPKILVIKNNIYIVSHTLNKCKDIEDVLKSHLIVSKYSNNKNKLDDSEILYLTNWEAEKYRQNI